MAVHTGELELARVRAIVESLLQAARHRTGDPPLQPPPPVPPELRGLGLPPIHNITLSGAPDSPPAHGPPRSTSRTASAGGRSARSDTTTPSRAARTTAAADGTVDRLPPIAPPATGASDTSADSVRQQRSAHRTGRSGSETPPAQTGSRSGDAVPERRGEGAGPPATRPGTAASSVSNAVTISALLVDSLVSDAAAAATPASASIPPAVASPPAAASDASTALPPSRNGTGAQPAAPASVVDGSAAPLAGAVEASLRSFAPGIAPASVDGGNTLEERLRTAEARLAGLDKPSLLVDLAT